MNLGGEWPFRVAIRETSKREIEGRYTGGGDEDLAVWRIKNKFGREFLCYFEIKQMVKQ